MNKGGPFIISVAVLAFASHGFAAGNLSDQEIAKKLIGSWRVPPSSRDYGSFNAHTVEIFNADGTYAVFNFEEGNCKNLTLKAGPARWTIKGGVLNSFYSGGGTDQDDVVNITDDKMTLHSHSDGTTFTRVKIDPCAKLVS